MFKKTIAIFALFVVTNKLVGQTNNYKIITQDVINFWEAVDSLKNRKDTLQIFQTLVIDRATNEFKVFIKDWKIKASDYVYQIRKYPNFYKTLRNNSYKLINSQDSIRQIISRFQNLYPNFIPADICIAFGNFNTGGTVSTENKNLVYIGLEYHGLDNSTFTKELSISTQDFASRSNFFRTIIHELVHIQQRTHGRKVIRAYNGNLLVNRILSEGIPDFISQLIVNYGNSGNHYNHGLQREESLKNSLKIELWNKGNGDWFSGTDSLFIQKPRDLGYFMGSRIGRNFYLENYLQNDLTELIEIVNVKKFISKSKYFKGL
jgi:hypothetical protein